MIEEGVKDPLNLASIQLEVEDLVAHARALLAKEEGNNFLKVAVVLAEDLQQSAEKMMARHPEVKKVLLLLKRQRPL